MPYERYIDQQVVEDGSFGRMHVHVPCEALLTHEPDMYDGDEHHAWDGVGEYLYRSLSWTSALELINSIPQEEDREWLKRRHEHHIIENRERRVGMSEFKFADMFAGIGGFHLAMAEIGGQCVWAAEINHLARKTYLANFLGSTPGLSDPEVFAKDVTLVDKSKIPDHDVLCAGFPCQPFSVAGHRRGLDDVRGTLFFQILETIRKKRPRFFFLENVHGLVRHDDGATFKRMLELLQGSGYRVEWHVVSAANHGLPQNRRRVFILGSKYSGLPLVPPPHRPLAFTMSDVFGGVVERDVGFTIRCGGRGVDVDSRHNWEAYRVDGQVQRLSVAQSARMMGFPSDFVFPVSETAARKQLGNAVAVPAVVDWGKALLTW